MTERRAPAPAAPGFLAGTRVILERELASTFDSNIAYVAAIGFLLGGLVGLVLVRFWRK